MASSTPRPPSAARALNRESQAPLALGHDHLGQATPRPHRRTSRGATCRARTSSRRSRRSSQPRHSPATTPPSSPSALATRQPSARSRHTPSTSHVHAPFQKNLAKNLATPFVGSLPVCLHRGARDPGGPRRVKGCPQARAVAPPTTAPHASQATRTTTRQPATTTATKTTPRMRGWLRILGPGGLGASLLTTPHTLLGVATLLGIWSCSRWATSLSAQTRSSLGWRSPSRPPTRSCSVHRPARSLRSATDAALTTSPPLPSRRAAASGATASPTVPASRRGGEGGEAHPALRPERDPKLDHYARGRPKFGGCERYAFLSSPTAYRRRVGAELIASSEMTVEVQRVRSMLAEAWGRRDPAQQGPIWARAVPRVPLSRLIVLPNLGDVSRHGIATASFPSTRASPSRRRRGGRFEPAGIGPTTTSSSDRAARECGSGGW